MLTSLRPLATTMCAAAAVVGLSTLTGCSSDRRPATDAAPATTGALTPQASTPATPSTPSTPSTPGSPGPSTSPAAGAKPAARPSGAGSPATRPAADPCPVSAAALLSALHDSPDFYQRAAKPAALQDVACASGYAIAGTAYDGQHQTTQIVFNFDPTGARWRPLNLGSADFCEGFVPNDIAPKLPACS
ncbi:hypothetical protein AB0M46_45380 [Dactylosporangium sp. NPDC051485]|uniref:hypothetical protein n=1 Tax=Dactylosporangium sp. NPDC051485 TaxID=3154846 RepID=UPI0034213BB7